MRRIFVVMGALLLLVALAGAQSVIKYSQIVKSGQNLVIGNIVEFDGGSDSIKAGAHSDSVIGFVGMLETSGSNTYALVINSGVISAPIYPDGSSDYPPRTGLKVSSTHAGTLEVAGSDDQIVAYTMDSLPHGSSATRMNVIINPAGLQPATNDKGAVIHATSTTTSNTIGSSSWTDLFSPGVSFTPFSSTKHIQVIFNGEFDDRETGKYGGAVIDYKIVHTIGATTSDVGQTKRIYLVDRDFYQKTVVSLIAEESAPTDAVTYNVQAQEQSGLDAGQFVKGYLIVLEIPRD